MKFSPFFSIFLCSSPLIFGQGHEAITLENSLCQVHEIRPILKNGHYFNDHAESLLKHSFDAMRIFFATKFSLKKYYTDDIKKWVQHDAPLAESDALAFQWIGHASFLMQVNGFNILTDPVFYHLHKFLYPRVTPVGIEPADLPRIDFVIISHNHRDHLDEESIAFLKKFQPCMLVPAGTQDFFTARGFKNVHEHTWWQKSVFKKNDRIIEFSFMPATHWSGRTGFDAHTSLWGGWLVNSKNKTVYFAGDSGFNETIFKAIADYAPQIDCALLPIGPCEPRHLMSHSHMSAEESVEIFKLLRAKNFIPMHWGTFGLGPDSFDAPLKRLKTAWHKEQTALHDKNLTILKFGQLIIF